jgi:hypothetical protein
MAMKRLYKTFGWFIESPWCAVAGILFWVFFFGAEGALAATGHKDIASVLCILLVGGWFIVAIFGVESERKNENKWEDYQ